VGRARKVRRRGLISGGGVKEAMGSWWVAAASWSSSSSGGGGEVRGIQAVCIDWMTMAAPGQISV
jgi:hypothetical protein